DKICPKHISSSIERDPSNLKSKRDFLLIFDALKLGERRVCSKGLSELQCRSDLIIGCVGPFFLEFLHRIDLQFQCAVGESSNRTSSRRPLPNTWVAENKPKMELRRALGIS